MYISIYVIEDSSVSDMLLQLPQPPAGAIHILACRYSATLTRAYHILRACSSDVLSKPQQSNSQHKAKSQSLIDRTQVTRDSPLEIF